MKHTIGEHLLMFRNCFVFFMGVVISNVIDIGERKAW